MESFCCNIWLKMLFLWNVDHSFILTFENRSNFLSFHCYRISIYRCWLYTSRVFFLLEYKSVACVMEYALEQGCLWCFIGECLHRKEAIKVLLVFRVLLHHTWNWIWIPLKTLWLNSLIFVKRFVLFGWMVLYKCKAIIYHFNIPLCLNFGVDFVLFVSVSFPLLYMILFFWFKLVLSCVWTCFPLSVTSSCWT